MKNIYRLKHIIRYSNVSRITNENVAEHSFMVAAIVIKLANKYDFDIGKATAMAVVHDFPEVYIDDVNHQVKRDYPKVAEALKEAEKQIMIDKFSEVERAIYTAYESQVSAEAQIVKYADVLQCIQYAAHEISLGNNGYMHTVMSEATALKIKLENRLKRYEK